VNEVGETTILTKATSKSRSLRTTIPMGIVKQDRLNWEIRVQDRELIIIVRPLKEKKGGKHE